MLKLDGMDGEMLKWMVASAIKCFQRCPTDHPHEELRQPSVRKQSVKFRIWKNFEGDPNVNLRGIFGVNLQS